MSDDQFVEDILENNVKKKKKVDGKSKGDRTELNLCKFLTKHFGKEFSRALGSGSRWSQVGQLPEHAKKTLTGDICVPEGFLWVIECKGGYEDDINLTNVCDGPGLARLDEFIEQVERDAEYCNRLPILLWKRNRKPWLAFIRYQDRPAGVTPSGLTEDGLVEGFIYYKGWLGVKLDDLLQRTDEGFWFETTDNCD